MLVKRSLPFVFLWLCLSAAFGVAQERYTNSSFHYSLTIPEGWQEIPRNVVEEMVARAEQRAKVELPLYQAAFQRQGDKPFTYPYVLIQNHQADDETLADFARGVEQGQQEATKALESSPLFRGAQFDTVDVDKKRNRIIVQSTFQTPGGSQIRALIGFFLGQEGLVQVNCYSLIADYQEQLPAFRKLLDSLEFEPGHGFDASAVGAAGRRGLIRNGIVLAVVIGLLVGCWEIYRKKMRRSQSK